MDYTLLSQINPTRHNWSIKVRVARMWQLSGTSKGKGFTAMVLVLIDEEGLGITASIGRKDVDKFAHSLVEGRSYLIKKFQVSNQPKKYNAVPNTHTIFFTPWTVVKEVPIEVSANLPLYVFNFVDFEDLNPRSRNNNGLVVIHPVVQSSGLNGPSVRRSVELRDLSDRLLPITLWGEHATSFEDEFLIETIGKDEPVVIIFAGMQVRQYLGATTCGSGAATKWYLNIDIPEVNAFRASLQGRGSEVLLLPGDHDAEAGALNEAGANRNTVAELLALDPHDSNGVRFTCDARIREINVSNGWWYKGCSTCRRGLKATLQGFECVNCDDSQPLVVPSYKLNLVIEDTTGHTKIFLFGGVAEQVVKHTAAELVEESSSNQMLLPAPLRSLVGRRYVFQVVISEQTFRSGQLCFQARRVFVPPTGASNLAQPCIDTEGDSPAHAVSRPLAAGTNTPPKGKEVPPVDSEALSAKGQGPVARSWYLQRRRRQAVCEPLYVVSADNYLPPLRFQENHARCSCPLLRLGQHPVEYWKQWIVLFCA